MEERSLAFALKKGSFQCVQWRSDQKQTSPCRIRDRTMCFLPSIAAAGGRSLVETARVVGSSDAAGLVEAVLWAS
jgi:hypothetical protein